MEQDEEFEYRLVPHRGELEVWEPVEVVFETLRDITQPIVKVVVIFR